LPLVPIFDLDGTLLDSDDALNAPFAALGVDLNRVRMGLVLEEACAELGVRVADYLAHYDVTAAAAFPEVTDLVVKLGRWAVCSNKEVRSGMAELARLGWEPEVAMFADHFGGPKHLGPVADALGVGSQDVLFIGDTEHDRRCAQAFGCRFALAGWNPRASAVAGDLVLDRPLDVLDLLE